MADATLGRTGAASVGWNAITLLSNKLLIFASTLVLVRVLDPSDFGLLGVGLVAIGYLEFVNDLGISAAVIQRTDDDVRSTNIAFWANMMIGAAMTLLGVLAAPAVAALFDTPEATDVVRVLSLTFLIRSVGSIHGALIRRELDFRRRLVPEVTKAVVKGALSIGLALAGLGVWSLVWGQLAGAAVASMLYWRAVPWRPGWDWDRRVALSMIGFGWQVTLVGLFATARKNIDYVFVGRQLGSAALGIYTIAFRLPQLVVESVGTVVAQVAFPVFSRLQGDPERTAAALDRLLRVSAVVVVPMGIGLALVADPLVRVAYGSTWVDAIDVMRVLSLYMVVQSIARHCGDFYKGVGRPGVLNVLSIVKLVVAVPLLWIAVDDGLVAVAWAQFAAAAIMLGPELLLASRMTGAGMRRVLGAYVPALRAATVMVLATLPVARSAADLHDAVELLVVSVVGVVSYSAAIFIFDRRLLREVASLVKKPKSVSA